MKNKIKEITIVFENCEQMTLPFEKIEELMFDQNMVESVLPQNKCPTSYVHLVIRDYDKISYHPFNDNDLIEYAYNRLKLKDITWIVIKYEDESNVEHDIDIPVPWNIEDSYSNSYQKNHTKKRDKIKLLVIDIKER